MGCFLGCFGGQKNHKRPKSRAKRATPQFQRNRVQDVHNETVSTAEAPSNTLVADFRNKPMEEEKLSSSPRKRVSFSSNITTYKHVSVSVSESIESLVECNEDSIENQCDLNGTSPMHSLEANRSGISTVGSFPPNHRYHNARESDDEAEYYGDSDLENLDEDENDEYNDYEPVLASSMESKRENYAIEEVENISQSKAVDASLSNWLDTKQKKTSSSGLGDYSASLKNFEDRPILGALTVEEVRQISANFTPRKSPSRSPDKIPIIGTVGTYWNHSASSTQGGIYGMRKC